MSRRQSLPVSPPPPRPEGRGLSTSAIIVIAIVVIVIVVGAVLAGGFLAGTQQAVELTKPNITVTDSHGYYTEDCGTGGSKQTIWHWAVTLVNNGATGFADIGYDVNGYQVMQTTHYVPYKAQDNVKESTTLNVCYGSTAPTYAIVVLAERSA